MKLNLKAGEHVRIATDTAAGSVMIYVEKDYVHVTATDHAGDPPHIVIGEGAQTVRIEH